MNKWTTDSLLKARRENVVAALKIRAYLRFLPYWQAESYRDVLRAKRAAARLYKVPQIVNRDKALVNV